MNTKTWVLEKTESAMFKDDMLPLIENQEKTSSLPSLLNFNQSRNSNLSSFFNKLEEKKEYCLIVSLIRGFNELELVHAQLVFSGLESVAVATISQMFKNFWTFLLILSCLDLFWIAKLCCFSDRILNFWLWFEENYSLSFSKLNDLKMLCLANAFDFGTLSFDL